MYQEALKGRLSMSKRYQGTTKGIEEQ
jgi:hypothetical protein